MSTYASNLTELCGIVPLETLFEWFEDDNVLGEDIEASGVLLLDLLFSNPDRDYHIIECEDGPYLASFELESEFYEDSLMFESDSEAQLEAMMDGEDDIVEYCLSNRIGELLCRHDTIPIRRFTRQELLDFSPLDYIDNSTHYQNLCAFLDEHVPDGQNDLNFAANVLELVYDAAKTGVEFKYLLPQLEDLGLIFDLDTTNKMLSLVAMAMNDTPQWLNNGHSPIEMDSKFGDRALADILPFPDKESRQRKVVKVGRNDPCPCGSGKKYKNCCLS